MATVDMSRIASALAVRFQDQVIEQMNRSVVLLQLLPFAPAYGQSLQWDTAYSASGESTDSTIGDGTAVSVFQDDDLVPATLQYATYSEGFQITGKARAIAAAAREPSQLADLFGEKLMASVNRLTKNIARDIYIGAGTTNKLAGLTGSNALLATGTYANIARSSFAAWASNEAANGAVARALTTDLMQTMMRQVYEACGEYPDMIVCDAVQHQKFGQLFDSAPFNRQLVQDVYLRGQKITLSAGYQVLMFNNVPIVADVNCPAGKMIFLNSRYVKMRQLPDTTDAWSGAAGSIGLQGHAEAQFGQKSTRLTAVINPLARLGDSYPFQLKLYPQLQVERPNTCGLLSDLITTI